MADSPTRVVFKLSNRPVTPEMNLQPEAWRVLTHVNGARTVSEIAERIQMDSQAAAQIAQMLLQAGLLEVVPAGTTPPGAGIDEAFFQETTRVLARLMGPLAEFLVDDEISALGESRQRFPRERMPALVERLGDSIRDEAKRAQFKKVMLELVNKF